MQEALEGRDDVRVLAIGPGSPEELRRYRELLGLTVPLLSDPEWTAYRAYGLGRAGLRATFLSPRHYVTYARLLARGRRLERPRQNVFMLGGDVLVDAEGRIAWSYRSRRPDDRPTIAEALAAVATL